MTATTLDTVQVDGLTIAYRELGSGPPVLLLHGWPTSSFLWRDLMEPIAEHNRVVAIDLPGFGASDKPLGVRYDFDLFGRTLDGSWLPSASRRSASRCMTSAGRWACIGRCTTRSA
jgi:pimeloyl-ACP methyl ester carboxylesterase